MLARFSRPDKESSRGLDSTSTPPRTLVRFSKPDREVNKVFLKDKLPPKEVHWSAWMLSMLVYSPGQKFAETKSDGQLKYSKRRKERGVTLRHQDCEYIG